jgi:hypothetical protein
MNSKEFEVGSVVYFMHFKTGRVLPAQVMERIMRTSLEGSKSTYILSLKQKDSSKQIEVDPETFEIFQTPEEMKSHMVTKAVEAINSLIYQAVESAKIFNGSQKDEEYSDFSENSVDENGNFVEVDLGDGLKAKLKP